MQPMTPIGSRTDMPNAPGRSNGIVCPTSLLGTPAAARNALMQYSTSKAAFICGEPTSLISKSIYTSRSRSTIDAASQSIFSLVRTSLSLKCSKVFLASATAVLTSAIFPFATRAMRSAFDGLRSSKYSPELGLCSFPPIHNSLVFIFLSHPPIRFFQALSVRHGPVNYPPDGGVGHAQRSNWCASSGQAILKVIGLIIGAISRCRRITSRLKSRHCL